MAKAHGVGAAPLQNPIVGEQYLTKPWFDWFVGLAARVLVRLEDLITTETDTTKRLAPNGTGGVQWLTGVAGTGHVWRFAIFDPPAGATAYPLIQAPEAYTITKVRAIRIGSGSLDVDVEVAGSEIVGTDITVGTSWTSSAALSATVAAADTIAVSLKNVVRPVTHLVVQIEAE